MLYILQRELLADGVAADDLAQDAFRITLERLRGRGLDHPEKLAGFIVGIVRRLLKARRRLAGRVRNEPDEVLAQLLDAVPSPCDELIRAEEMDAIRTAVKQLSVHRDRELLTRRYLLDEDNVSICRALGLTSRQLDRALYRARLRLKRQLGELRDG